MSRHLETLGVICRAIMPRQLAYSIHPPNPPIEVVNRFLFALVDAWLDPIRMGAIALSHETARILTTNENIARFMELLDFQTISMDSDQLPVTENRLVNTTVHNIAWSNVAVSINDRWTRKPKAILDDVEGLVKAGSSFPPVIGRIQH